VKVVTAEGRFTYIVDDVKLVPPQNIEVMQQTKDAKLTLITCGGEFDTKTRSFSDRQIVVAHLADWARTDAEPNVALHARAAP
jgi:LPXTG-site transpeptidase (sortase) family protein